MNSESGKVWHTQHLGTTLVQSQKHMTYLFHNWLGRKRAVHCIQELCHRCNVICESVLFQEAVGFLFGG